MKRIILSLIVVSSVFISCKKDKAPATCEKTVAGIAANYKISKIEIVSTSGNTDITNTILDACKKDAIYQLKANNSFIYTEIESSCSGSSTGSWNVANNAISISSGTGSGAISFTSAPITGWDCSTLTVTQDILFVGTASNAKFTFVKQ